LQFKGLLRFQIGFVLRLLWHRLVARQALPDAIAVARSVCRVHSLVGHDSNLVVRRIIKDTIGIVSHDRTLAHLWRRLAALLVTTSARPDFASVLRHPAFVICHPALVICHLSFPIPHSAFRIF